MSERPAAADTASGAGLAAPVTTLHGVGPVRAARLADLGVRTVGDLLRLVPRRWEDRSHLHTVAEARAVAATPQDPTDVPGDAVTVRVRVLSAHLARPRPGLTLLRARIADDTGAMPALWFNQPYLAARVRPGARLLLHGRVRASTAGPRLHVLETEVEPEAPAEPADGPSVGHSGGSSAASVAPSGSPSTAPAPSGAPSAAPASSAAPATPTATAALAAPSPLLPFYPLVAGLQQRAMRALVAEALARVEAAPDSLPDPLPEATRRRLALPPAARALADLHRPADAAARDAALRRLALEELLLLQLGLALRRRRRERARRGFRYAPPGPMLRALRAVLPFALTAAQARVLAEIEGDLRRARPMQRLVQGDVGSGKTVLAAAALVRAVESGRQAALMAPTEVLAEQHHQRIGPWLGAAGARVRLLTGRQPAPLRAAIQAEIAAGEADIVIGTHALIQQGVRFDRLGLVVTDEQHRFGVRQRERLAGKGGRPDVLAMTATPIPRTLALTLYGDLDVSALDELPPGRQPVRTFWRAPAARPRVYRFVGSQIAAGRQAFVVCPRIEGMGTVRPATASPSRHDTRGEDLDPHGADAVTAWAEQLRARWLPGVRVGVLHGRLPAAEREDVMAAFAAGDIQCLCATTVVEVGIDVPNASVMVVEGADRFGLAQLHQLRGRVGRGGQAAWCILLAPDRGGAVAERLRTLEREHDGFALAEADLALRGPGEVLGLRQHGLPPLRVADPVRDLDLLVLARDEAARLLADDPGLRRAEHRGLRAAVEVGFAGGG